MKRSFSALFVLLTALSGPLVFTPSAICRQNSAVTSTDESADVRGTRTEADQPKCEFSLTSSAAPEDLVIVPEDFNYEIYEEPNQCEIEQNAALEKVQNDTAPPLLHSQADTELVQVTNLENLCLPFAEYEPALESWAGPAIAGHEDFEATEDLECELAGEAFLAEVAERREEAENQAFEWAVNIYYEKSYATFKILCHAIENASFSLFSAVHWANNAADWQGELIVHSIVDLSIHSCDAAASRLIALSQTITNKHLTEIKAVLPTPPYCECWARATVDEVPVDGNGNESSIHVDSSIGQDHSGVVEGIVAEPDSTDAIPDAISNLLGQNDDFCPLTGIDETPQVETLSIDFSEIHDAAVALLHSANEQVETLQRWSKEYRFEDTRKNELKFEYP